VQVAWRQVASTGVVALAGAIVGAAAGFALGALVGPRVGLPHGRLLSDAPDEGFDQLDLALWLSFVALVAGAVSAASRYRRSRLRDGEHGDASGGEVGDPDSVG
jgi:hypothetical protein